MRYILMLGLVALAGCVGSGQGSGTTGSLPSGSLPSGSLPSSLSGLTLPSDPSSASVSSITDQAKQVLGGY